MARYAKVIIDCSAEAVDRAFTYRIPEALSAEVFPGVRVLVPFGSASAPRAGYVTEITEDPGFPEERIKELLEVPKDALQAEGEMIALAAFMAREYGSTMNQALKTVIPIKRRETAKEKIEQYEHLDDDALISKSMGFVFDSTPVQAAVNRCKTITQKYHNALMSGYLDPDEALPRFLQELEEAGIQDVIDEKQSQLDIWLSSR